MTDLQQAQQAVKNIPAYHSKAMHELREEQLLNESSVPIVPHIQNNSLRERAAQELTFYVVKNELLNAFMPVTDKERFNLLLEAFVQATHELSGELTTMNTQLRAVIEDEQPTTFDQLQHLLRRLALAYEGSTPVDSSTVEQMVTVAMLELTRSLAELKEETQPYEEN